jgi:hypothetical protein
MPARRAWLQASYSGLRRRRNARPGLAGFARGGNRVASSAGNGRSLAKLRGVPGPRKRPAAPVIHPPENPMEEAARPAPTAHVPSDRATIWKVIAASSVGTMIEWYDFYIFGSLATILAGHFFPQGNSTLALLQTLATFAAGFAARPFGALFFGRIVGASATWWGASTRSW